MALTKTPFEMIGDPNSWGAPYKAAQQNGGSIATSSTAQVTAQNLYYDGTNWRYIATGPASMTILSNGALYTYAIGSGTGGAIATLGNSKLTVDSAGIIGVDGGIKFPNTQNPSSDVNTLDDYEEGTWTPTLACSGTQPTYTNSNMQGYYTKIGSVVHAWFIWFGNITGGGTGGVQINGLPFSCTTYRAAGVITYNGAVANSTSGYVEVGTSSFYPVANGTQNVPASWTVGNTLRLFFQVTYSVN